MSKYGWLRWWCPIIVPIPEVRAAVPNKAFGFIIELIVGLVGASTSQALTSSLKRFEVLLNRFDTCMPLKRHP